MIQKLNIDLIRPGHPEFQTDPGFGPNLKFHFYIHYLFYRVRNDHEVDQNLTTDLVGCRVAERVPDQLGDFIQLKRP